MTRVKGGTVSKTRRRKVLKLAKGYFGSKHRLYKTAQEQLFHSGAYAYRDRKQNKRNFRKLWITRINAACEINDMSYSRFINGLNKAGIEINRKMLSEIAIDNPQAFTNLVNAAKDGLAGKVKKVEPKTEVKKTEKAEIKAVVEKPKPAKEKEVVKELKLKTTKVVLADKTLTEIKALAKEKGIKGYTTMKKADLIIALEK